MIMIQGSRRHQPTQGQNPSGESSGKDHLTENVKHWIMTPILLFHMSGFVVLSVLCGFFIYAEPVSPYVWPALIAAIAGIPFGFAANVKKLLDAVIVSSS